MQLLERSEAQYISKYIFHKEAFVSDRMDFGKQVAVGLEQKSSGNPQIEALRLLLPDCPRREFSVVAEFNEVPLIGIYDGYYPRPKLIIDEYKTGENAWSQNRVDSHGQLMFYNLLHLAKYRTIAKQTRLHWAQTARDEDGEWCLTGRLETFVARITLDQVLIFAAERVQKGWDRILEISAEYQNEIKQNNEHKQSTSGGKGNKRRRA